MGLLSVGIVVHQPQSPSLNSTNRSQSQHQTLLHTAQPCCCFAYSHQAAHPIEAFRTIRPQIDEATPRSPAYSSWYC